MPDIAHKTDLGSPWVRARLWFSYQRYVFLLVAGGVGLPVGAYVLWPDGWYVWAPLGLFGLFCLKGAVTIFSNFGHKLRVTAMLQRRYARVGFSPTLLAQYAEDPCYRVVSNEVMRRVGVPPTERRRVLAELKHQASLPVVYVRDPETGALVSSAPSGPIGTPGTPLDKS